MNFSSKLELMRNLLDEMDNEIEGMAEAQKNISDLEDFGGESYTGEDMHPEKTLDSCELELAYQVMKLLEHTQDMADNLPDPPWEEDQNARDTPEEYQ